ncbi:MAG: hypothetical protein AAFW46_15045, partial [Pseudomonadota bacterium]
RALARWPSYFERAWADLKPAIGTPGYEAAVARTHETAVALVRRLPNPGGLTPHALRASAAADGDAAEVRAVVGLFQWLLPGLLVNVAAFRAQLFAP